MNDKTRGERVKSFFYTLSAILGIAVAPVLYIWGVNGRVLATAAAVIAGLEYLAGRSVHTYYPLLPKRRYHEVD